MSSGKCLLVEVKAHLEKVAGSRFRAQGVSRKKIRQSLEQAKQAYGADAGARWETPFYQYANWLAHLYFLVFRNRVDASLVFLYFANVPEERPPCTAEQWEGARRLPQQSLGLGRHGNSGRISTVVIDVPAMCRSFQPTGHG